MKALVTSTMQLYHKVYAMIWKSQYFLSKMKLYGCEEEENSNQTDVGSYQPNLQMILCFKHEY